MTLSRRFSRTAAMAALTAMITVTAFAGAGVKSQAATTSRYYTSTSTSVYGSYDSTRLLAALIYCEANNQSYTGKVAVGSVVMNRVASSQFPNTITGVIFQNGQFYGSGWSFLKQVYYYGNIPSDCYSAAQAAIAGQKPAGNALFYMTTAVTTNGIIIGDHCFFSNYHAVFG